MTENRLARETSPYLLQHKDNPVDWQPWSEAALARARAEDKPILLSVGYSACHWCHVMAHESFEDAATAELMNELFVNIKVDREERPDLDAIYQHALALLGEQGGWPLTMFLTPAGEPFWGGTYFPSTPRFGRPAFRDILRAIHDTYRNNPEKIAHNTQALTRALERLSRATPGGAIERASIERGLNRLLEEIDTEHGGFGRAPKFPMCNLLELLWRHHIRTGEDTYGRAVAFSLERMSMGGIYDHLGGGYARYSTDERWLAPHFEKMLYDNAQILSLLTHLWRQQKNPLFEARARETVGWLLREMQTESGAFAAALDADSEGEEGAYYVWREAEIDRLLGAEAAAFKAVYDVAPGGNWEGKTILNRLAEHALRGAEEEAALAQMRQILLRSRERRVRPSFDDAVLADWNGLMIASLAEAAGAMGEPSWLAAAERAFEAVANGMTIEGRLCHAAREGRIKRVEFLDDYANMAKAALALNEITGRADYRERAEGWVAVADRHYWDAEEGGYFFTPDDGERLITRSKSARDQATPAGNGVIAEVLARLYFLTGKQAYRERAEAIVAAFSGEIERQFANYPTLVGAALLLEEAVQIVVAGDPAHPETKALLETLEARSLPQRVVMHLPPGAAPPQGHPAQGKTAPPSGACAYVCVGPVCSAPARTPAALDAALASAAPARL